MIPLRTNLLQRRRLPRACTYVLMATCVVGCDAPVELGYVPDDAEAIVDAADGESVERWDARAIVSVDAGTDAAARHRPIRRDGGVLRLRDGAVFDPALCPPPPDSGVPLRAGRYTDGGRIDFATDPCGYYYSIRHGH